MSAPSRPWPHGEASRLQEASRLREPDHFPSAAEVITRHSTLSRGDQPVFSDPGIKTVDGEDYMSCEVVGLLTGNTEEQVLAEYRRQAEQRGGRPGGLTIPKEWVRQAKEIQARHGTNDARVLLPLLREEARRRRT
jgi:hypothetical protein